MKKQINIKKLILLNLPYILVGLFATNFGEAWRLAQGGNASEKMLGLFAVPARCAGELLAQPPPAGFAGGHLLRSCPAVGSLSERQERQKVPAQCRVWFRPAGVRRRTSRPILTRCSRTTSF